MANPNTAHEPSMEEILASIRQIISEDSDLAPAVATSVATLEVKPEPEPLQATSDATQATPDAARPAAAPAAKGIASASASDRPANGGLAPKSQAGHSDPMTASADPMPKQANERPAAPPAGRPAASTVAHAEPAPHKAQSAEAPPKLLSEDSKAAVSGAFGALAHTIFAENARTLEDIVAEMLRPMLKGWLDDNLPPLVERLVREEIERVSRGRR